MRGSAILGLGLGLAMGMLGCAADDGGRGGRGGPRPDTRDAGPGGTRDSGRRPPTGTGADSDHDGLTDDEEAALGTDPYAIDSDGDGVTDLGEVRGSMTDPLDPASTIPPGDFFVVLPYLGGPQSRTLRFGTNLQLADVYFLIDTTGSMSEPIANVRSSLSRIAGEIAARIPDVQMGVGHFEDLPFGGVFCSGCWYGDASDEAYRHLQDITGSLPDVQRALDGLTLGNGADGPESQSIAVHQTATGAGGDWRYRYESPFDPPMDQRWTLAPRTCASIPDEVGRRRGYPCFRPGALPIVVLVTDVVWHNGTDPTYDYAGVTPAPPDVAQAADALHSIGGRYIGVQVDGGGRPDAESIARATGSVDAAGRPLVYDAAGGAVGDTIIDAIRALAGGTPQDVDTARENVDGNPDGFDATRFIVSIVPLEGFRDGVAGTGYTSKDATTFYGVTPGTLVDFTVAFDNTVRMPAENAQIFRARIRVVGNRVATLDTRNVYIIVPADGEVILI